jgi:hypothetical protein
MQRPREPSEKIYLLLAAAVIAAGVIAWYFWQQREQPPVPPAPVSAPAVQPPPADRLAAPEIKYPVPEVAPPPEAEPPAEPIEPPKPLPLLDESDAAMRDELGRISDERQFADILLPESIVRHFVVTIDNLPEPKLPKRYGFTKPPEGQFLVTQEADGGAIIDQKNYVRYDRYVRFVETADIGKFVALYVRYYPLFQRAYEELGYPNRYFNDRFVEVIDHLLAAPEVRDPVRLVRPKVFYQFADPALEALSAGQKILIRVGPDNAARIKARLRELRQALTALAVENRPD